MGVTLACDHRVLYGADGADFLVAGWRSGLLEEPLGFRAQTRAVFPGLHTAAPLRCSSSIPAVTL